MRSSSLLLAAVLVSAGLLACSGTDGSVGGGGTDTAAGQGGGSGPGAGGATGGGTASGGTNGGGTNGGANGDTPGGGGTTPPGSGTPGGSGTPTQTPPPPGATTISADETWDNGKQITTPIVIAANATVTIAPGAQITIADGATIIVDGTLKGTTPAAPHAALTGKAWGGIVVDGKGTLALDGVDLVNAAVALDTKSGNAAAAYAHGIITAPTTPFHVEAGSKLSFAHVSVVKAGGESKVEGALVASFLDYDSNGNEGVFIADPAAVLQIDDSSFHGTSDSGGDMITSTAATSIHFAHSEISKCHCAFHFSGITSYDISLANVHDTSYGFMMYGSSTTAGKRSVAQSNFTNLSVIVIDETIGNGATSVTGNYFANIGGAPNAPPVHLADTAVTITGTVKKPVAGVGPTAKPGG